MKPEYYSQEGMAQEMDVLLRHMPEHYQGTVMGRIPLHFYACDYAQRSYTVCLEPTAWMADRTGNLSNGAFTVALDQAMGILDIYFSGYVTPTITLQMSLIRPMPIDRRLYIKVQLVDTDGKRNSLTAVAWSEGMEQHPACNAFGIYYVSNIPLAGYEPG